MTRLAAVAIRVCASMYRAYYATLRIRVALPDSTAVPLSSVEMTRDIFAICERDTLALGGIMPGRGFTTIVAHGRDGDWAAAALHALGGRVIRGSTRSGGVGALVGLFEQTAAHTSPVAIVVDGPLGPAGIAKPGVIACGIRSGRPVRPLGVAARYRLVFPRTWSGIFLPLPFSTVWVALEAGLPLDGVPYAAAANYSGELTKRLHLARDRAVAAVAESRVPFPAIRLFTKARRSHEGHERFL
jgi:lysophospholipid acyltransferase (LPLAT)-like uncharacterized protein